MSASWVRRGRVWAFGDDVGIEAISPLRYMLSPEGRGRHCLEFVDPAFAAAEKDGDLIVAGRLFGHGPGHDHAILAIKEAGIAGVIATSFAPQLLRHAVGHGLLVVTAPGAPDRIAAGDEVEVDFETGEIADLTNGSRLSGRVPEGPAREVVAAGGLIPFIRARAARG
jgi:3-isopropylmalate/(R)-2-methylmalate dehydratase small subunit